MSSAIAAWAASLATAQSTTPSPKGKRKAPMKAAQSAMESQGGESQSVAAKPRGGLEPAKPTTLRQAKPKARRQAKPKAPAKKRAIVNKIGRAGPKAKTCPKAKAGPRFMEEVDLETLLSPGDSNGSGSDDGDADENDDAGEEDTDHDKDAEDTNSGGCGNSTGLAVNDGRSARARYTRKTAGMTPPAPDWMHSVARAQLQKGLS